MTRKTLTTLAALGLTFAAGAAHAATLTVAVTGIEKVEGAIMLAMFDAAEAYGGAGAPVRSVRIPVSGAEVTTTFEDLPAGRYAIKLYHDANGNGEMDTNMVGLPIEGYGFSGNGGRFGPPAWDDAAFEVSEDGGNTISIRLR